MIDQGGARIAVEWTLGATDSTSAAACFITAFVNPSSEAAAIKVYSYTYNEFPYVSHPTSPNSYRPPPNTTSPPST